MNNQNFNHEQLISIIRDSPSAIGVCDQNGRFQLTNKRFQKIFGYSESELSSLTLWDLTHEEFLLKSDKCIRELYEGKISNFVINKKYIDAFGNDVFGITSVTPIKDEFGNVVKIFATIQDVTKGIYETLTKNRDEIIGQMTLGVVHDFNNLLTIIKGHFELIRNKLDEIEDIKPDLDSIRLALDNGNSLNKYLLNFAKSGTTNPEKIDINKAILSIIKLTQKMIGKRISVKTELDLNLVEVYFDKNQFDQILLNLLINSRDAIEMSGEIVIRTSSINIDTKNADMNNITEGSYLEIQVGDNGRGMEKAILDQIFQKNFSTKRNSEGSGFGLYTISNIIQLSGGAISVESKPSEGSTFKILVPANRVFIDHASIYDD